MMKKKWADDDSFEGSIDINEIVEQIEGCLLDEDEDEDEDSLIAEATHRPSVHSAFDDEEYDDCFQHDSQPNEEEEDDFTGERSWSTTQV